MKRYTFVVTCVDSEIRGYFQAENMEAAKDYAHKRYLKLVDSHGAINYFVKESPLGWGAKI